MTNKTTKRKGIIFGLLGLGVAILSLIFIVPNTLYLLKVGFTLQNILTGKLPENYVTGDGSTFNAVETAMWVGGALTIFLGLISTTLLFKSQKVVRN